MYVSLRHFEDQGHQRKFQITVAENNSELEVTAKLKFMLTKSLV